jgi:ABC-2 type transport system ATP-binding protein
MTTPMIEVKKLRKVYQVSERDAGVSAALRGLFQRKHKDVVAVDDVTFEVQAGEIIGFLGPNGAGKTTTLKMMAGLLYPTSGEIRINGHVPSKRDNAYLREMSLVMGQRNQLQWDIPANDSFDLMQAIYNLPPDQYRKTLDELVGLLGVEELVRKPVRNLSLGERMKCEMVGALLHRPTVLFLDEPTIGLDVTAQRTLREFIAKYNKVTNATIMLTSHYMADVEALAQRVIIIHHGKLLFDGNLADLIARFSPHKTITVQLEDANADLSSFGKVMEQTVEHTILRIPKADTSRVTSQLLAALPVRDIAIEDPTIEEVIEQVFNAPQEVTA